MTRSEKRQEKRAQEQALRKKELEAKGFNFVGSEEYYKKIKEHYLSSLND